MTLTIDPEDKENLEFLISKLEGQIKTYQDECERLTQKADLASIQMHVMKMKIKTSEEYLKKWRLLRDED